MLLICFVAALQELKILFITSSTVPTFNCTKYLSQWKHNFWTARNTFLNEIAIVDRFIIDQHEIKIIQTFLYDNPTYSVNDDKLILNASMTYILETKRFDGPIF